eukprot:7658489-Pyramimonas_sp.AAC.1
MMSNAISQATTPAVRAAQAQRSAAPMGAAFSSVQGKKIAVRAIKSNRTRKHKVQVVRAVAAPNLPDITLQNDAESLTKSMVKHFQYTLGEDPATIGSSPAEAYRALAYTVSERLAANFKKTQDHFVKDPPAASTIRSDERSLVRITRDEWSTIQWVFGSIRRGVFFPIIVGLQSVTFGGLQSVTIGQRELSVRVKDGLGSCVDRSESFVLSSVCTHHLSGSDSALAFVVRMLFGHPLKVCLLRQTDKKYGYYLSMEFLQGRALLNAIENLKLEPEVKEALAK